MWHMQVAEMYVFLYQKRLNLLTGKIDERVLYFAICFMRLS